VVIARELMAEGGVELQHELEERFIGIRWISLPADRDATSLARELACPGLDVLLIEADDHRRQAMIVHIGRARRSRDGLPLPRGRPRHSCRRASSAAAIVSDVSFCRRQRPQLLPGGPNRRFPEIRWIVTTAPQLLPVPA